MKAPFAPATEATTRAATHQSSKSGIAMPAVPARQEQSEADPLQEDVSPEANLEQPLDMDMDEDGVDESHLLFVHPEDGTLWLHSDAQTLSLFLKRKRKKNPSANVLQLLKAIEDAAVIVHTGKYGTKGTGKRKAPNVSEKQLAQAALKKIAKLLVQLNQLTNAVMKKSRPPSHQHLLTKKIIGSDTFCEKVVMAPLSVLRRDDGVEGSSPQEETTLWRTLTQIAGYKRGHMLNEHLHGPGVNTNLVPISTAFNSTMKTGVEKATKEAVNGNNKVVRFEAEALNWGNFNGAFGFPDEQLLPDKFHFKVTQMTLIPGNDGSKIAHWQDSGKIIFEDSPDHDIPVDVVPGVVAPIVKTFAPGYYFHPGGKIKPAPNATDYHLIGNFSINNMNHLLPALGLDDSGQLRSSYINEKVLTAYRVPPGYHIVYPFPSAPVEQISRGKIYTNISVAPAFLIVNTAKNAALKISFEEEKKTIIKKEEQQKQQQLDAEALEKKKREERIEQERIRQETNAQKKLEKEKNDNYRHDLLARLRQEARKYEAKFNGPSLVKYRNKRESILFEANEKWKTDEQIFNQDIDSLLDPLKERLVRIKDEVSEWQSREEEKGLIIDHLLQQLREKIDQDFLPALTGKALSYFQRKVAETIEEYTGYWERKIDILHADPEKLLESPIIKLFKAFETAKGLPMEEKRLVTDKEEIIDNLLQQLRIKIGQEFLPALHGEALSYFKHQIGKIFKTYVSFWEKNDELTKYSEKWLTSPMSKLRNAFKTAEKFLIEEKQPATNRNTSPEPFNLSKRKREKKDDEEAEKEVQETRFEPFRLRSPASALKTEVPDTTSVGPFTLPTKKVSNSANTSSNAARDHLINTATQIWELATHLHRSSNNNFLQQQLFQLEDPMRQFTANPTQNGWYIISGILSQLEKIDDLKGYVSKWIFMWNSIRP
jgi:hypothetical protein